MLRTRLSLVLLLIAFTAAPSPAQVNQPTPIDRAIRDQKYSTAIADLEGKLEAFREARQIPGLSVCVGVNGRVVWASAIGNADLATKTSLKVDSVFPVGSTSKALTSLALGRLYDRGKIDLDAPIQKYVPYFPQHPSPITPRQLAGHQAGIRNYDMQKGEYDNTTEFHSVRDATAVFRNDPLLFEPGTQYAYSVYGFTLLSAAIESAAGTDFLSFMASEIFRPLGLKHTGPDRTPSGVPLRVTCYDFSPLVGKVAESKPLNVSNKWAAGGFVSTPSELVEIGNALLRGRIVKKATMEMLFAPQKLKSGEENEEGYAMGWRSGRMKLPTSGREVRVAHHGGVANGAMTFLVVFPDDGVVVALSVNLSFKPFWDFGKQSLIVAERFLEPPPRSWRDRQSGTARREGRASVSRGAARSGGGGSGSVSAGPRRVACRATGEAAPAAAGGGGKADRSELVAPVSSVTPGRVAL